MSKQDVGVLLAILSMPILLLCFVLMVYYAHVAIDNRKPDAQLYPGEKPWNILFRPHQLTEKGLKARKSHFICLAVMLITFAIISIIAVVSR